MYLQLLCAKASVSVNYRVLDTFFSVPLAAVTDRHVECLTIVRQKK